MAVQVLVLKEQAAGERRVAATPETVKKLVALGASVWIEPAAGRASSMDDAGYLQAGAQLANAHTLAQADMLLCVQ
ncbi:NAD(P) transhydrogenase subunit alpha, partial [Xanthomonas vesicatoria]